VRRFLIIFILTLGVVACDVSSNTPAPDQSYFVKYFGGDGNQFAVDMLVDVDGMIYILGNSKASSGSNQRIYLAKVNPRGQVVNDTLITSSTAYSEAKDLDLALDGDLIIAANQVDVAGQDMNVLVMKVSKQDFNINASNILWTKVPKSPDPTSNPHRNDYVNSVTILANGNYILTGYTDASEVGHSFDIMNLQVDANLNKIPFPFTWNETSGPGNENYGRKALEVIQSPDTARYIFGNSNAGASDENVWYAELQSKGYAGASTDDQSDNVFISSLTNDVVTHAMKYESGHLITSISTPVTASGNSTLKLYRLGFNFLNPKNSSEVTAYYEWPLGNIPNANASTCKASVGFLVVADYLQPSSNTDILLLRLNGSLKDPVYFGGEGDDRAAAVAELTDGHILVLGTMQLGNPPEQFKIALIKVNANGKFDE
jgi:hypothetical protein